MNRNEMAIMTKDYWRYGESADAGNRPVLARGERVKVLEPASPTHVYVETAEGHIERVAREALRPAD